MMLPDLIRALCAMNLPLFASILPEEDVYCGTTKAVFIEAIQDLLDRHRSEKDTSLLAYPAACIYPEGFEDYSSYYFVGNVSGDFFTLCFWYDSSEAMHFYFDCMLEKVTSVPPLQCQNCLHIYEDDLLSFPKTPGYWRKLELSNEAFCEMVKKPLRTVNLNEAAYWLEKHRFTYEAIGGYDPLQSFKKWDRFGELYWDLKEFCDFMQKPEPRFEKAYRAMEFLTDEQSIIGWLLQYEEVLSEVPSFNLSGSCCRINRNGVAILLVKDRRLLMLSKLFRFYREQQGKMLHKYGIYTAQEEHEIYYETEAMDKRFLGSLRFHLGQREQVEEMGIQLPLFIAPEPGKEQEGI